MRRKEDWGVKKQRVAKRGEQTGCWILDDGNRGSLIQNPGPGIQDLALNFFKLSVEGFSIQAQ
ncbi:MAG TPA: hypothetical protein VLW47_07995, partial [Thermodesulfobacteriota bacterium]|nr:hypothetical protein [Thermodesulfobacteriota bacterium]